MMMIPGADKSLHNNAHSHINKKKYCTRSRKVENKIGNKIENKKSNRENISLVIENLHQNIDK
jgi:hypothetical protein